MEHRVETHIWKNLDSALHVNGSYDFSQMSIKQVTQINFWESGFAETNFWLNAVTEGVFIFALNKTQIFYKENWVLHKAK